MIPVPSPVSTPRMTWFMILLAMVMSIILYGLVAMLLPREALPTQAPEVLSVLRPVLFALAAACLFGSIVWVQRNAQGTATTGLPSPRDFQVATIIGLVLAEACALWGLVLFLVGGAFRDLAILALAALAVDLFYILPKGRAYWAAWEEKQRLGR